MEVETIAAAAATKVVSTTTIASSLKASTLPGLKPNHPTHRRRIAIVNQPALTRYGTGGLTLLPLALSSRQICHTMPRPAAPAAPCPTSPPATATIPSLASHPLVFQIHAAGNAQMTTKEATE